MNSEVVVTLGGWHLLRDVGVEVAEERALQLQHQLRLLLAHLPCEPVDCSVGSGNHAITLRLQPLRSSLPQLLPRSMGSPQAAHHGIEGARVMRLAT